MLLGKPGSGKTTFLQHIAMHVIKVSCYQSDPDFYPTEKLCRDASEVGRFSLLNYIHQELRSSGISDQQVETLLHHGKALILLDGWMKYKRRTAVKS